MAKHFTEIFLPVKKEVVVDAAPARAFDLFTGRIGEWWPKGHSVCAEGQADVRIEPKRGGKLFETCNSGGECMWGDVLDWTPPQRLLLAWRLNAEWVYDPDFLTEVEVLFAAEGQKTRVTLVHGLLENYGDKVEQVRQTISSDGGWPGIMNSFAQLAAKG